MSDPTRTAQLRRSFLAEGNRRLAQLRSQTYNMLVHHDLMAAKHDPIAEFLPHPGERLAMFSGWFARTANYLLLGEPWWERFLQRAYESGVTAGNVLVGLPPRHSATPVPMVYRELAAQEFAGIVGATIQQVSRQAAGAALGQLKPGPLYRAVLMAQRKVAVTRIKLAVNSLTVQLHNAGRLLAFGENGITRVGIDAERLEPARPSRFVRPHDHLMHDQRKTQRVREELFGVLTAGDDKVCSICTDLADEGPYLFAEVLGMIPAHPNCLPGNAYVAARHRINAVTKRIYEGELVIIRTASGHYLECTPNHPILTERGFVAAHLLDEGNNVICERGREWELLIDQDDDDVPTRIEKIASTFAKIRRADVIPISRADFHGDTLDGQVAIIWANRFLLDAWQSTLRDQFDKAMFGWRSMRAQLFARLGSLKFDTKTIALATATNMSRRDLSLALNLAHARPFDQFLFGSCSQFDSGSQQDALNRSAIGMMRSSKGNDSGTFAIGPNDRFYSDRITSKGARSYHGNIYNMETASHWYVAQGIITHNCRCAIIPFSEITGEE